MIKILFNRNNLIKDEMMKYVNTNGDHSHGLQ